MSDGSGAAVLGRRQPRRHLCSFWRARRDALPKTIAVRQTDCWCCRRGLDAEKATGRAQIEFQYSISFIQFVGIRRNCSAVRRRAVCQHTRPPRLCAWCGTRFKIILHGPPGYLKTDRIARVNSRRFSIGLWCTRTFRGGSPRRRPAHTGGGVSRPHHLPGCRGAPPACVLGVGRVSKYFFVAPRATSKLSVLPESTLVGLPLDCGAHAPSGGGRPDGAPHTP